MTKTVRTGILYFAMAAILIAALITIRPETKTSPPSDTSPTDQVAPTSILPEQDSSPSTFELKLTAETLYFTAYNADGSVSEQKIIDYIDIYSLYTEQLKPLQKGITFKNRESVAEFIQDLGS